MKHTARSRILSYSLIALGAVLGLMITVSSRSDSAEVLHGAALTSGAGGGNGGMITGVSPQSSDVLPDLSVSRVAPSSFSWDGFLDVQYVVTNAGGRVAQANLVEKYVSASYDAVRRVTVAAPISFHSIVENDQAAHSRVRCAPVGGVLRCLFSSGIDAGESIAFTVRYVVPPRSIQCDANVTLASVTVSKGLIGAYPTRVSDIARQDINYVDNVAPEVSTRIDCSSITGDLAVRLSGPVPDKAGAVSYIVTVANEGSVRSIVPSVQVTFPASGFEFVSATGVESDGMCVRMNRIDALNQRTCVNPSVLLEPGANVSYKFVLRSSSSCIAGTLRAAITTDMRMPTPFLSHVYEVNTANNTIEMTAICDRSSSSVEGSAGSSSTSSSWSTSSNTPSNIPSNTSSSFSSSSASMSPSSAWSTPVILTPFGDWSKWWKR